MLCYFLVEICNYSVKSLNCEAGNLVYNHVTFKENLNGSVVFTRQPITFWAHLNVWLFLCKKNINYFLFLTFFPKFTWLAAGIALFPATWSLVRLVSDVAQSALAASLASNLSQRCLMGLRSALCRDFHFFRSKPGRTIFFLMELDFAHGALVIVKKERAFVNLLRI